MTFALGAPIPPQYCGVPQEISFDLRRSRTNIFDLKIYIICFEKSTPHLKISELFDPRIAKVQRSPTEVRIHWIYEV